MNNIILPEIVTCGYFDCVRKFGSLKQSPKRTAANIEIELFLEDGRSTYIDGREFPVLKNHIVISKKEPKDIANYLSRLFLSSFRQPVILPML